MTISVQSEVMTADEKPESSHEYNFFLDRQLQNKLLDFEEQDIDLRFIRNVKLDTQSSKAQTRCDEVTGWIYDSKITLRKPEKECKQTKEFIQPWKDYKTKQKDDCFIFQHYGDLRKYIQQYREDHSNILGFGHPGVARSDISIGDLRKYLHHHSAPSPGSATTQSQNPPQTQVSTVCTQCANVNSSNNGQQLLTASMHYTNRKDSSVSLPNGASVSQTRTSANLTHQCSKHNHIHINADHAYKYKLAPDVAWRSESVQSSNADTDRTYDGVKTPRHRITSAKGGKSPTKVMVPAGASNGPPKGHPLQTVTVQSRQTADSHVLSNSASRTLDTLACVAAEKQLEPDFPLVTAGMTWCERLELLRAVNKRPEKVRPKPPRIRFFKDPPSDHSHDPSGPLVAQSTRARLYEQRHIKHLLEQAKVKGSDQFEWLTDSGRFRTKSSDTSDSSDDDYDELCSASGSLASRASSSKTYGPGMDVHNAENSLLHRYNMPLVVKGGGWKMTPYPGTMRSHSTMFKS